MDGIICPFSKMGFDLLVVLLLWHLKRVAKPFGSRTLRRPEVGEEIGKAPDRVIIYNRLIICV